MRIAFTSIFFLAFFIPHTGVSQHPERFRNEIDSIVEIKSASTKNVILFTGSSSIRLWKNLKEDFPRHNVVNMGFGGSNMKDLLFYTHEIILPLKPTQVFIYEGDNDIASGMSPEQIIGSADSIVTLIRKTLPNSELIFISAKPSLRRWHLRDKYQAFNQALLQWTKKKSNVKFADVWTLMLDGNGNVQQDIFVSDQLHLNDKGYSIWQEAIGKFLK